MRLATLLLVSAALLPALARAETLDEYLAARKKHGVTETISQKELERITGTHTIEIAGKVVGTIGKDGDMAMLVKAGKFDLYVDAGKAPDWIEFGVSHVRLLISFKREDRFTMIEAKLISSVEESDIAPYEEKLRKEEEARIAAEEAVTDEGYKPVDPTAGTVDVIGINLPRQLAAMVPDYMTYIMERNKKLPIQDARRIAESILAASANYGVEARLVVALIQAESNFNPRTTSVKGAQGLGQLMPVVSKSLGITDPYNIEQNVFGSVRTLRGHIDRQSKDTNSTLENLTLALAAYNAGPGAVKKYGGVPPYKETEAYIAKVIKTFKTLTGKN